jgi:hypothetical protein
MTRPDRTNEEHEELLARLTPALRVMILGETARLLKRLGATAHISDAPGPFPLVFHFVAERIERGRGR